MDWRTLLSILGFGAALISTIAGILSAFQSRSTPFVYKPPYGLPVKVPAPSEKSAVPVPPPFSTPAPAPDPYLDMRLAIRKELEADQKRSFWPNLWMNLAISAFFYLAGVVTTMVVSGH